MKESIQIKRIPKTTFRRLRDLEDHLYFLTRDLIDMEKDESHYKRVAAELRLLICKMKRNKPLLLDLIKEFNKAEFYNLTAKNQFTEETTKINILDYPSRDAGFYFKGKEYSNQDIIITIASQDGSGHEDNAMDEGIAFCQKLLFGGASPTHSILYKIGLNIKNIGLDFLNKLEKENLYKFHRIIKGM